MALIAAKLFNYYFIFLFTGADVEQYLHYVGGAAGMLAVAGVGVGVAAASAYYLASRPVPTLPPFDLENQTIVEVRYAFKSVMIPKENS